MTHNDFSKRYFEDFAVGDSFDYGQERVTSDAIIAFAREFDPEPYHLDDVAARDSLFGGLAASGLHVASLWRKMHFHAFADTPSAGSPGWDEIRWKAPTRPGDILSAHSVVTEARPLKSRPELGMIKLSHRIDNQHGEVKMTFIGVIFYPRRPTGSAN